MLFTPYCLTDAVNRDVNNIAGILMVTFSGLTTGGRKFEILARLEDVNCWINGELIQVAMPYLSADEREILMKGIDSESWEEMFGGDDDGL